MLNKPAILAFSVICTLLLGATSIAPPTPLPTSLILGQPAPDFTLPDLDAANHTLSDYTADGKIVVLEWFNPRCPFVRKHYRDDARSILDTLDGLDASKIVWLRINSAYATHPSANLELNKKTVDKLGIKTPLLMDLVGTVGNDYFATRTPEIYIIDAAGNLAYHGSPDDRSDAAAPGKTNHIKDALTQLLAGEPVSTPSTTPYGCRIKYD